MSKDQMRSNLLYNDRSVTSEDDHSLSFHNVVVYRVKLVIHEKYKCCSCRRNVSGNETYVPVLPRNDLRQHTKKKRDILR